MHRNFLLCSLGLEGLRGFLGGRGVLLLLPLLFPLLFPLLLPFLLLRLLLWDQLGLLLLLLLLLLLWNLLLLWQGFLWWWVCFMLRGFIGVLLPQFLLLLLFQLLFLGVAFLSLTVILNELFLLLLQVEIIIILLVPAWRVLAVADGAVAGVVGVPVPLVQLRVPQALVLEVLAQLGAALAQLG